MRTKNSFPKYSFFLFICNNFKQYSYLFSQRIFFVSLQESNNLLIFLVNCRFHTTNHTTFLFFTILIFYNNKYHVKTLRFSCLSCSFVTFLVKEHFPPILYNQFYSSTTTSSILPSLSLLFTKMFLLF